MKHGLLRTAGLYLTPILGLLLVAVLLAGSYFILRTAYRVGMNAGPVIKNRLHARRESEAVGADRQPGVSLSALDRAGGYLVMGLAFLVLSFIPFCRNFSPLGAWYNARQVKLLCETALVGQPLDESEFFAAGGKADVSVVHVKIRGEDLVVAKKNTFTMMSEQCWLVIRDGRIASKEIFSYAP